MKSAFGKDILRSIRTSKKRFLSILIITALGVTVLVGIYAACRDMYFSADRFYDEQRLFDVRVLSTLGLTDDDVASLEAVSGVEVADGSYNETVRTQVGDIRQSVDLVMLSAKGLNTPYVLEGALPARAGEIAVTQDYLDASGKSVGDTVAIEETVKKTERTAAEEPAADSGWDADWMEPQIETGESNFLRSTYVITGVVLSPMNITNENGAASFRANAATDYTFFVTAADVQTDVYTSVYLTLAGMEQLNCYGAEYEKTIYAVISYIETRIQAQRERARYEAVVAKAQQSIRDAEKSMNEAFGEVDGEFAEARGELADGKKELQDAENILAHSEQALAEAEQKLAEGRAQYETQKSEAETQFAIIDSVIVRLKTADTGAALDSRVADLKARVSPWPQAEWDALAAAANRETAAALAGIQLPDMDSIGQGTRTQLPENFPDGLYLDAFAAIVENTKTEQEALRAAVLATGADSATAQQCISAAMGAGAEQPVKDTAQEQIAAYEAQKAGAMRQLADAEKMLAESEKKLIDARLQLDEARAEIESGWSDLAAGWSDYYANAQEYDEQRGEALQKIADAYAELDDMDMTQWYVQSRASLDSYSSLKSDMQSIEAIGNVFPVIFLIVAILISLTTMTRMVEEDRGLIGTYKSLGFDDAAIYRKYLLYALLACLLGGVLGDLLGFIALPLFLSTILRELYILPEYLLRFNTLYGIGGIALFTLSVTGATALACRGELRRMPAQLMRPKAPKAGSRVFLEKIGFIWNRLKFLNKVTARNLFRYKKRLFMTVCGIMGCTALVLVGFAIKDSVTNLMPKQYDRVYQYDLLVVADGADNEELVSLISGDERVQDCINPRIDSVKALNSAGRAETVQMIVVPDGMPLTDYIRLLDIEGGNAVLDDSGVLLTENAAEILGIGPGDTVALQTLQLDRGDAVITHVVENYMGNTVYLSQGLYERLFGDFEANGILAHLSVEDAGQRAYAAELLENDIVMTSSSVSAIRKDFSKNFALINSVVYVLIILAAGLAFVVLFTLSNTNISERERELATIKVLGFYNNEVHAYVNKETLILTVLGVLLGLPLGRLFSELLAAALKMPSINFTISIHPISYVISGVIAFLFAMLVNGITDRSLDRINMVEALKSVE